MYIRFRRGWLDDINNAPPMRHALRLAAENVADDAQQLGRRVAGSYKAKAVREGDKTLVQADTDGINAAGWIEFGTGPPTPTPAYAPLRKAAEGLGLKTTGRQR